MRRDRRRHGRFRRIRSYCNKRRLKTLRPNSSPKLGRVCVAAGFAICCNHESVFDAPPSSACSAAGPSRSAAARGAVPSKRLAVNVLSVLHIPCYIISLQALCLSSPSQATVLRTDRCSSNRNQISSIHPPFCDLPPHRSPGHGELIVPNVTTGSSRIRRHSMDGRCPCTRTSPPRSHQT